MLKEFYLVDGDFDELLGIKHPNNRYFYRLGRYDIEAYLIEEEPVSTVAEESKPHKTAVQYKELLQLNSWISEVIDASLPLAACSALLRKLGAQGLATSQAIERFVVGDNNMPDKCEIQSYISEVKTKQSVVGNAEFDRLLENMILRMGISNPERRRWISGKHILIPLVAKLLRRHAKCNAEKESLCFRLAKNCNFSELSELRDRILAVAQVSA